MRLAPLSFVLRRPMENAVLTEARTGATDLVERTETSQNIITAERIVQRRAIFACPRSAPGCELARHRHGRGASPCKSLKFQIKAICHGRGRKFESRVVPGLNPATLTPIATHNFRCIATFSAWEFTTFPIARITRSACSCMIQ